VGATEIANAVLTTLSPLLPYLAKAGVLAAKSFTEGISKAGGESAWKAAQGLWKRITDAADKDTKLKSAVSLVATDPEDNDYVTLLAKALEMRLAKDESLRQSLVQMLGGPTAVQQIIAERGSRIAGASQELHGSGTQKIVSRDNSVIENATQKGRE
jgi:hypothetical protein